MIDLQRSIPATGLLRWAVLIGTLTLAGCVFVPREQDFPSPSAVETEPPPAPPEAHAAGPAAEPAPPAAAAPTRPAPPPEPPRVVVLLPAEPNGIASVVDELEALLTARGFAPQRVGTGDAETLARLATAEPRPLCVVAVGSQAATPAIEQLQLPIVYGQVPGLEFSAAGAWGVATMPPPALQLAAWQAVDPGLRRVALILSGDEYLLAAQARHAATSAGVELALRTASSDREALYIFRRMAGDVDGLWLLPDNAIMSPRTVRDMLEHADARDVQSLVFTPSLLEWGASISVSGTPRNIAATMTDVVERIRAGEISALPAVTPLSELEIRVNPDVMKRLGLSVPAESWVVTDGST